MRALSFILAASTMIAVSAPAAAQQPPPPAPVPAMPPAAMPPAAMPPAAMPPAAMPPAAMPPAAMPPAAMPGAMQWGYAQPLGAYGAPYAQPYGPPPAFAPWGPAPVPERRSPGMVITAIALWGTGGVATAVGAILLGAVMPNACVVYETADVPAASAAAALRGRERIGVARQALSRCDRAVTGAFGSLIGGSVAAIVAIPLFVVGNRRDGASAASAAVPELKVGATSAELRWAF
jgi:hypothetical protein